MYIRINNFDNSLTIFCIPIKWMVPNFRLKIKGHIICFLEGIFGKRIIIAEDVLYLPQLPSLCYISITFQNLSLYVSKPHFFKVFLSFFYQRKFPLLLIILDYQIINKNCFKIEKAINEKINSQVFIYLFIVYITYNFEKWI